MTSLTDPVDSGLLAKVRKLLAMAEGSSNSNEADAFSRKAAELIAAHRIDPERLRSETRDDLDVVEIPLGRGAYVRGRLSILTAIGQAHGCTVVFEVHQRGTVAFVAGFRSDLDTTALLYHSLHTQAATRMASERRATAAATQQWRRSFLFGYADQIRSMLQTTADQARQHVHPANSTLPALRARDRQVDEFARQRFGRIVAARRPKPATPTGWDAGRRAASRADLGRKRVGGLRAIGSGSGSGN
ncbi:MAG: DUF2786 domain-containing protein [Ilumatobacteraceae bacterium]